MPSANSSEARSVGHGSASRGAAEYSSDLETRRESLAVVRVGRQLRFWGFLVRRWVWRWWDSSWGGCETCGPGLLAGGECGIGGFSLGVGAGLGVSPGCGASCEANICLLSLGMSGGKGGSASAGIGVGGLCAAIDAFLPRNKLSRSRRELAADLIALPYAIDRLKRTCFEISKDV